jgi:Zn finger protein HypA/HybF involved in hydrogenase expression
MKVKKPDQLTCLRCNHVWTPRGDVVRVCPSCKSSWWDLPRKNEVAK